MVAWFFATALAKQWDQAIPYIEQNRLAPWTHNKTIQKVLWLSIQGFVCKIRPEAALYKKLIYLIYLSFASFLNSLGILPVIRLKNFTK